MLYVFGTSSSTKAFIVEAGFIVEISLKFK